MKKTPNLSIVSEILEVKLKSNVENELAFLGLTSKIENPIRDRVAFELFKLFQENYIITREWKKFDLAVLDGSTFIPVLLIEFKACYSFDLIGNFSKFLKWIKADLRKLEKKAEEVSNDNAEFYSILIVTKPKTEIPEKLMDVIKYSKSINGKLKKFDSVDKLESKGLEKINENFEIVKSGNIKSDIAYGIGCEFDFHIIKNIRQ